MDAREQRGREIAAKAKIRRKGGLWVVPSTSGDGTSYTVDLDAPTPRCSCPDYTLRRQRCKHIYAVEYTIRRETTTTVAPDGSVTETVTETVQVTKTTRPTYPQNWRAYNAAQTTERPRFLTLLHELTRTIQQPPQTAGRPRLPLADMTFACVYKVYSLFSARRFTGDLTEARQDGLIATVPHFNSVGNYLANPDLTPILKRLITLSSLPLKAVETSFAVDSSGFGTSRFVRWYNKKYGREIDNREWIKVHLMCGVKTNIVTSVDVSGWAANDTPYFKPLVETSAAYFQVAEVSADKAYLSHTNLNAVDHVGGKAYIPFKSNTAVPTGDSVWARMYHYFMYNRESFLDHYHKRSNVETVFSMIKGKFGDAVRSKTDTAQINEALCKVLAHNICVVIQSIEELGIEPAFCADSRAAQKVPS